MYLLYLYQADNKHMLGLFKSKEEIKDFISLIPASRQVIDEQGNGDS